MSKAGSTLRQFHGRNVETLTFFCRCIYFSVTRFEHSTIEKTLFFLDGLTEVKI